MSAWDDRDQRDRDVERLRGFSGLQADGDLLGEAVASSAELAEELEAGYVNIHVLRDAVAQVLIGQDWPAPDALQPIAEAAAQRGLAFIPVRETITLSADELAEARELLLDGFDLVVTDDVVRQVFHDDPDFYAEFEACGRSVQLDTMLRESFVDAVVNRFVGRHWPMYGDTAETTQAFYEALEAAVVPGVFELNQSPSALLRRAAQRQARGDLAGALALAEAVLAADPELRPARAARAEIRQSLGQHDAALSELDALAEAKRSPRLSLLRGFSLAELGQTEEAVSELQRYVDHLEPPPTPDGRVVRRRGRPGELEAAKAKLAELRAP